MDANLREAACTIDVKILGERLLRARQRSGLTQGAVADQIASTAYVSRIESGQRRPSPEMLVALADRLGASIEELLEQPEGGLRLDLERVNELRLQLDFAEMSLRTGSARDAVVGAESVLAGCADLGGPDDLQREAEHIRALGLESMGELEDAIEALEALASGTTTDLLWIRGLLALSRCYRMSGDLARAAEVGDRATERAEALELLGTDDGVRLSVTVAAAYFERGDVNHAIRLCKRVMARADALETPAAQASVYWNSSMMEASAGRVEAALPLAKRALALMETMHDAANLARLRGQLGVIQLELDPPDVDSAMANLSQSAGDFAWSNSSPADFAMARLGLARANFLQGNLAEAEHMAQEIADSAAISSPFTAAEAALLLGRVAAERGDAGAARTRYALAERLLGDAGTDRGAAEVWFQLGALYEELGMLAQALNAFRRAGASTGLRNLNKQPVAQSAPESVTTS